jgi:hypothetical protein
MSRSELPEGTHHSVDPELFQQDLGGVLVPVVGFWAQPYGMSASLYEDWKGGAGEGLPAMLTSRSRGPVP